MVAPLGDDRAACPTPMSLIELSDDITLQWLRKLDPLALCRVCCACRRLRELACDEHLWAALCARTWQLPRPRHQLAAQWPRYRAFAALCPVGDMLASTPESADELPPGALVTIHGLANKPQFEGRHALVLSPQSVLGDESRAWLEVCLLPEKPWSDGSNEDLGAAARVARLRGVRVRPANLRHRRVAGVVAQGGRALVWKAEFARRHVLDALAVREVRRAYAELFDEPMPPASADAPLTTAGEAPPLFEPDDLSAAVGALGPRLVRAAGEQVWEALRGLAGERTREPLLVEPPSWAGPAGGPSQMRAPSRRYKLARAFALCVTRDVRRRDWCRLEGLGLAALCANGRDCPVECGALVLGTWDDPFAEPAALLAEMDRLAATVGAEFNEIRQSAESWGGEEEALRALPCIVIDKLLTEPNALTSGRTGTLGGSARTEARGPLGRLLDTHPRVAQPAVVPLAAELCRRAGFKATVVSGGDSAGGLCVRLSFRAESKRAPFAFALWKDADGRWRSGMPTAAVAASEPVPSLSACDVLLFELNAARSIALGGRSRRWVDDAVAWACTGYRPSRSNARLLRFQHQRASVLERDPMLYTMLVQSGAHQQLKDRPGARSPGMDHYTCAGGLGWAEALGQRWREPKLHPAGVPFDTGGALLNPLEIGHDWGSEGIVSSSSVSSTSQALSALPGSLGLGV